MWFYLSKTGVCGPFSSGQLEELARQGVLDAETLVRFHDKDDEEWQPAKNFTFLELESRASEKGVLPKQPWGEREVSSKTGCGIMIALLVIYLVTRSFLPSDTTTQSSTDSTDEKMMALTMAQNFVKDNLKSPSSASFPWSIKEYRFTQGPDGVWGVSGSVEAVNVFNAKLKKNWSVEMKREGANWRLLSIYIRE